MSMLVARKGEWLSAMIGDECAMMSVDTGNYLTLSRVGARIWELIETPITVGSLHARLIEEFDVPADTCEAELGAFLAELVNCQAATLSPSP